MKVCEQGRHPPGHWLSLDRTNYHNVAVIFLCKPWPHALPQCSRHHTQRPHALPKCSRHLTQRPHALPKCSRHLTQRPHALPRCSRHLTFHTIRCHMTWEDEKRGQKRHYLVHIPPNYPQIESPAALPPSPNLNESPPLLWNHLSQSSRDVQRITETTTDLTVPKLPDAHLLPKCYELLPSVPNMQTKYSLLRILYVVPMRDTQRNPWRKN